MSLAYIRQQYGVPAHRGRRVVVHGKRAVIAGATGALLRVRIDGDTVTRLYHPTDDVQYEPNKRAALEWKPVTTAQPEPLVDVLLSAIVPGETEPSVFYGWRRASNPNQFLISGSETDTVPGVVYAFAEEPAAAVVPPQLADAMRQAAAITARMESIGEPA
ncbi:MAG: hypothetical protein WBW32_10835 [Luteibacter sp.]